MEEHKKVIVAGFIFILLVALGVGVYYIFFYPGAEETAEMAPQPEALTPEEKPLPSEKEMPEVIQVNLDESDAVVRELVEKLSSHPQLAEWLMTDDIIRKFVAAVDNIANGQSPRSQVDFFAPKDSFGVIEEQGKMFINPESYKRYDLVAEVFASLDTEGCVILYRRLKPAIQEAYRDLGYPEKDFHPTLMKAIQELLDAPVVEGRIPVEKKVVTYMFTEPGLEGLSPAQKHLLRMGPENTRKIQNKLREFRSALSERP